MANPHYNRFKAVLAVKDKNRNLAFRTDGKRHWNHITMGDKLNKVQPSVEQLYEIANHLDVDL